MRSRASARTCMSFGGPAVHRDGRNAAGGCREHGPRGRPVFRFDSVPTSLAHAGSRSWDAAQSWPTLVLPGRGMAFIRGQRHRPRLPGASIRRSSQRSERIRQHGDLARDRPSVVGPRSGLGQLPRPVAVGGLWPSSPSALDARGQQRPEGRPTAFWELKRRSEIFGRTIGVANHEAGAITQGVRLRTPSLAAGRAGDALFEGRLRRAHAADDDVRGRHARSRTLRSRR